MPMAEGVGMAMGAASCVIIIIMPVTVHCDDGGRHDIYTTFLAILLVIITI